MVVAEDGIKGVARHRAERPELVITDMVMPRQGGAETIIKIRREVPDARILAVSGGARFGETHPLIVARKLGATDTLRKPFTVRELTSCVARSLNRTSSLNTQRSPASLQVRDRLPPRTI